MNRNARLRIFDNSSLLNLSKRERNFTSSGCAMADIERIKRDIRRVGVSVIERGMSIRTTAKNVDYSEDFVTALLCAYVQREISSVEQHDGSSELGYAV